MKTNFKLLAFLLVLISAAMPGRMLAQFQIKTAAVGGGFTVASDSVNQIRATVGQAFIGQVGDTATVNQIGFWYQLNELVLTGIDDPLEIPGEFKLHQNYPNPFNPTTTIRFELPKAIHVKLEIFNVLGQRVALLVDEKKNAGVFEVELHADQMASGFYFYRLVIAGFVKTRKMLLVR